MKVPHESLVSWLRLLAVQQHVSRALGDALAPSHLGLADYEVLLRVAQAGDAGVRMQELARRVFLTDSGITRLVERLEKQRLLERRLAEGDQRGRTCTATAAGQKLLRTAQPRFLATLEQVLGGEGALTRAELVELGRLLGKVATTPDADAHATRSPAR